MAGVLNGRKAKAIATRGRSYVEVPFRRSVLATRWLGFSMGGKLKPSRHKVAPTGRGLFVGACLPREGLGFEWAKKPKPSRHEVAPTGRCFFVGACLPRDGGVLVFGFPDSRLLTQFSGLSPPVSSSHFNFKEATSGGWALAAQS